MMFSINILNRSIVWQKREMEQKYEVKKIGKERSEKRVR